jgi:hypothetical protein
MGSGQRVVAVIVLLVAGILSLPVVAFFFDGQGSENWIVPVQLLVMALLGVLVGRTLGLAGPHATTTRSAVVGAVTGVVCAIAGVVLFFLLLSGFDGA